MNIEQFVAQSEGEWKSMRSGHSLAFKQFDEILSVLKITLLNENDVEVLNTLEDYKELHLNPISPFKIEWKAESNWEGNKESDLSSGSSLLIPSCSSEKHGIIVRTLGYAEKIKAISKYSFLSDGTLVLSTEYKETAAEERIWFISKNVRCRSSVIRSKDSKAILQTSYASEIRRMKKDTK